MKKKKTDASPNQKDAEWESLAKELRGLIPQLDSGGLIFLVEQARVHLHNMQIDEINKATANRVLGKTSKAAKVGRGASKTEEENLKIIGSESGSSYYLHYRNNDIMFSRDEMIRLVKIVNAPGKAVEIQDRLYSWFDRERKDIFAVISLKDKFDSRLKTLIKLLKENFKVRER